MKAPVDVAVIGGGIVGTSAAWFLAEAGASVAIFERAEVAAGASGRNSGSVQRPFDPVFARLHRETLEIYGQLTAEADGFAIGADPAGLLLVSADELALHAAAGAIEARAPDLRPVVVADTEMALLEPSLAPGIAGCLLATGYPVAPAAVTKAFARRALRRGVQLRTGVEARPVVRDGRVRGVALGSGEMVAAGSVLVAAGPLTGDLVAAWQAASPIRPVWGVVASVELDAPPTRILEELGIDDDLILGPMLFSLVTAGSQSALGSTFLDDRPDPAAIAPALTERGAQFVPTLATARVSGVRACARPVSADGLPLVGPAPDVDGLFVCAGHGPWGISTAPASARLVSRQMLASDADEPEWIGRLSPLRFAPGQRVGKITPAK